MYKINMTLYCGDSLYPRICNLTDDEFKDITNKSLNEFIYPNRIERIKIANSIIEFLDEKFNLCQYDGHTEYLMAFIDDDNNGYIKIAIYNKIEKTFKPVGKLNFSITRME